MLQLKKKGGICVCVLHLVTQVLHSMGSLLSRKPSRETTVTPLAGKKLRS